MKPLPLSSSAAVVAGAECVCHAIEKFDKCSERKC